MGSGSTGVASMLLNRKFIGIEKDQHYYKQAKARIDKHIGTSKLDIYDFEFDVNNLQVLCTECHKKKTKNDLKIAMGKDPTSGNEKEIVINMDNTDRPSKLDEFTDRKEDML